MRSSIQPSTFSVSNDRVSTIGTRTGVACLQNHPPDLVRWLTAITLLVVVGFSGQTRAATDIRTAKDPVIVSLPLPSAHSLLLATPTQRAELVQELAMRLTEVIEENPGRLVTLDPGRGRLRFMTLPPQQQAVAFILKGDEAPVLYELSMAALLDQTLEAANAIRPNSPVSVLGLPLEPRRALPGSVQDSNDRYQRVIARLDAFVSTRSFVLLRSRVSERQIVRRGLPEAFRLRQGRPIIFRTNAHWRILFGDSANLNEFDTESLQIADVAEPNDEASVGEDAQDPIDELALGETAEGDEETESLLEVAEDVVLQHDPFADPSDDSSNGENAEAGVPSLLAVGIGGVGGGRASRGGRSGGSGGGGSSGGGGGSSGSSGATGSSSSEPTQDDSSSSESGSNPGTGSGGSSSDSGSGGSGSSDDSGSFDGSGSSDDGSSDDGANSETENSNDGGNSWNPDDEFNGDLDDVPLSGGFEGSGSSDGGGSDEGGSSDGSGSGGSGSGGTENSNDGGNSWDDDDGTPPPAFVLPPDDDDPGDDGWTVFTASPDTHIIYVSSSTGGDSNLEYYYLPSDPEIGDDPFNPVGNVYAYETIGAAKALLRNDKPDWLLLKRGDVWENQTFGHWKKRGRAADEPMLISSYGGSPDRPWLRTGSSHGLKTQGGGGGPPTIDNLAIVGIHFEAHTYNGTGTPAGIRWLRPGENFLVEDCLIEGYSDGLTIQGEGSGLSNFALRRSVIVDSYSTDSHAQGMFMKNVHGALIEQNVFDHNGWSEDVPGAEPTVFNHNMYVNSNNTDVIVRGNISADASSHGLQLRPGGIAEDNLFVRNSIAAYVSRNPDLPSAFGILRGNVVLDGKDIGDMLRGWGLHTNPNADVLIENNIVANKPPGVGDGFAYAITGPGNGGPFNVILRNNISYNWNGNALSVLFSYDSLTVENNLFQIPAYDARTIYHDGPLLAANFSGNIYHSNRDPSEWFRVNDVDYGFDGWVALSGETGAQAAQVEFVDPGRTLATYHGSIGGESTHEAFMAEVRQQSKQNWRQEYTANAVILYIRAGFQAE